MNVRGAFPGAAGRRPRFCAAWPATPCSARARCPSRACGSSPGSPRAGPSPDAKQRHSLSYIYMYIGSSYDGNMHVVVKMSTLHISPICTIEKKKTRPSQKQNTE